MNQPLVTIIAPVLNEAQHIRQFLRDIVNQTWRHGALEVLIVDGKSDDGTVDIVEQFLAEDAARAFFRVQLLENRARFAPHAMNIGIMEAKGEYIVRMDLHSNYPADYVETMVEILQTTDAAVVGPRCTAVPGAESEEALLVSVGLSSRFGVGNSAFRLDAAPGVRLVDVDTVPFGVFRRDVFDAVGGFDESLARNEDDELMARIRKSGRRVALVPGVTVDYHTRPTLQGAVSMLFQYGYYKPRVVKRIGELTSIRQLVPPLFVLALVAAAIVWPAGLGPWPFLALLCCYFFAALVFARSELQGRFGEANVARVLSLTWIWFRFHLGYGGGYLLGLGGPLSDRFFSARASALTR